MKNVADLADKDAEGLLDFIHHPITNGISEGLNSTIQSLKHPARGLANFMALPTRIPIFLGKLDPHPA